MIAARYNKVCIIFDIPWTFCWVMLLIPYCCNHTHSHSHTPNHMYSDILNRIIQIKPIIVIHLCRMLTFRSSPCLMITLNNNNRFLAKIARVKCWLYIVYLPLKPTTNIHVQISLTSKTVCNCECFSELSIFFHLRSHFLPSPPSFPPIHLTRSFAHPQQFRIVRN